MNRVGTLRWSPLLLLATVACATPEQTDAGDEIDGSSSSESSSSDESGSDSDSGESSGGDLDIPAPANLPDPMVVMTFNVLCSFCDDSYDPWLDRLGYISDTIARHDPDLLGSQELFTADEVQQLIDLNPDYTPLFYSDETSDYADATIWYRSSRYQEIEHGFYWLSPAPDLPFSVGFSTPQLPRLVAWARLQEIETLAQFLFVTTHFDNNSPSQELSAPLLLERTQAQAGDLPVVVVGDFNSTPASTAYGILTGGVDDLPGLRNSFDLARSWSVDSNQDPVPAYDPDSRIDHIFVGGPYECAVPWWVVDTWVYGPSSKHCSDHFAMIGELDFFE